MGAEREPAFAHYPFYPILFHEFPPVGGMHIGIGRRASARTIVMSYSCGTLQAWLGGGCESTRLTFIDEPLCVLFVAFDLFSQFLDRFGIDLLRFVDQLFAGRGVALYNLARRSARNRLSACGRQ
jgi:hypothetical protein